MNNPLQAYYDEVTIEGARMMEVINRHADDYPKVVEIIKRCGRAATWDGSYADLGFKSGQVQGIIIQIHLTKTEGFKVTVPIIAQFLELGFAVRSQHDNVDLGYREIILAKPNPEPTKVPDRAYILLTIRIWPPSDSEVCERVECGTTPIYKLQCKGDP